MLSPRELAALAWLALILGASLLSPTVRRGLFDAGRSFFKPAILGVFATLFAWIVLGTYAASLVGLWTSDLLAPTILWTGTAGVVLLFTFVEAAKDSRYILHQGRNIVTWALFLEFFVNVRTFRVVVEFILQGFLGLLVLLSAFASASPEHRSVARLTNRLLSMVGLFLLVAGLTFVVQNLQQVATADTLRDFALPIWLGVWALPLIAGLGLYTNLDRNFRMMGLHQKSRWRRFLNILPLMFRLGFKPQELHHFRNYWERELAEARNIPAASAVVQEYVAHRTRDRETEEAEAARLVENTGKDGVDEDGRRLDQREFKETWRALDRIATWQMGWYDREPAGYKKEKIEQILSLQEWNDLPDPPEIQVAFSGDRQAWVAWRRTVSDWVLAVGGRDGTNQIWKYDGREPPATFPEPGPEWGQDVFEQIQSPNW